MQGTPSKELKNFVRWLHLLGYAKRSIETYRKLLGAFFKYLEGKYPDQDHIESFNDYLHSKPISSSYIKAHLNAIAQYSKYLEDVKQEKLLLGNLFVERYTRCSRTLFSKEEIHQLYTQTADTPKGLWDRALLGLHYGCGLRSKESIDLVPEDIDYHRSRLYVRPSKNYYDRYVPISKKVLIDLIDYVKYARESLNPDSPYFLVGMRKANTQGAYQNKRLKLLIEKASGSLVHKKYAGLHSLRHSIATHLFQGGMDIEGIAHFLGHRSIGTTQLYIQVNLQDFEDGQAI